MLFEESTLRPIHFEEPTARPSYDEWLALAASFIHLQKDFPKLVPTSVSRSMQKVSTGLDNVAGKWIAERIKSQAFDPKAPVPVDSEGRIDALRKFFDEKRDDLLRLREIGYTSEGHAALLAKKVVDTINANAAYYELERAKPVNLQGEIDKRLSLYVEAERAGKSISVH